MAKKIIPIKGMHCRSCEILIEEELLKIKGVSKVKVSEKDGTAEIFYKGKVSDLHIENAVCSCGYSLGTDEKSWISKDPKDYRDLFRAGAALIIVYFIAKWLGFFNMAFNTSNNLTSLPVVLLIGITAGFSTCMALVGGLVLGVSARFSEKHPGASALEKFKPHVWFNLGRILWFLILGGLIGYFGSFLQLGTFSIGFLTILVGIVMLSLGFQTIGIFPKLEKFKLTLPKNLYKLAGIDTHKDAQYSNRGSFILGGLTFFLPCGFTQAMQLFAISSGSVVTGALTMGLFALGTAPGLLGIGGLTSLVKGAFAKPFFKFVGLMVIALSIFNISNGINLTGISLPSFGGKNNATARAGSEISDPNVTLDNGVQLVRMTQGFNGYSPRSFTIQKDIPVKWVITSTNENTCAASIYSSQLNIRKKLYEGENIIEFTPSKAGTIKFSCSMGMFTGSFNVVEGSNSTSSYSNSIPEDSGRSTQGFSCGSSVGVSANGQAPQGGGCGGSGGCGCGGGGNSIKPSEKVEAKVAPAADGTKSQVQIIKATYTAENIIQPNNFTVKANMPVRLEILAQDDGVGCMGSVALPGLADDYYIFEKGQTVVFNFTPAKTGKYKITCAMGVPSGTITVN